MKYEYLTEQWNGKIANWESVRVDQMSEVDYLNEKGKEGWMLCCVKTKDHYGDVYYFRRVI